MKRVGIIGFGEMGKRHALEFREATSGQIQICGVVEPDDRKYLEGVEWNHCDIPRFASIGELLKTNPDGIIISSPNYKHYDNLIELEAFNKPILLEKPLDTNLERICDIVRFAQRHSGIILVDHVMRYAPIVQEAKRMIEEGKIGKVCSFEFIQRMNAGAMYHTFRRSLAKGGGHLIEKATHDLDVALFLTGAKPVKTIMISKQQKFGGDRPDDLVCSACPDQLHCDSAQLGKAPCAGNVHDVDVSDELCVYAKSVDVPDNECCLIQCNNQIFGSYSHNYFSTEYGRTRVYEIIGTTGALLLEFYELGGNGSLRLCPRNTGETGGQSKTVFEYFGKIHYNGGKFVARHFYNLMCGTETTPFTTVEQAFLAEALGLAAMKSAELDRYVHVADIVPDDLKSIVI